MARNPEDKWDVIENAEQASRALRSSIRVLPNDLSPGSREVALLTSVTTAQAEHIIPMAEALQSLRNKGPGIWGKEFLVADGVGFDWRTAPLKRYESFEDFYSKELAPVFGAYEEFLQTADRVARGEISAEDAAQQLSPVEAVDKRKARAGKAGRPAKDAEPHDKSRNNITRLRVTGTRRDYLLERLQRDAPELFTRVETGELTANAAAIEAGIKPKTCTIRTDNPASIVGTLRRQLDPETLETVVKLLSESED